MGVLKIMLCGLEALRAKAFAVNYIRKRSRSPTCNCVLLLAEASWNSARRARRAQSGRWSPGEGGASSQPTAPEKLSGFGD